MTVCATCDVDISHRDPRAKTCSQRCNMALWRERNPEKARAAAQKSMKKWREDNPERARRAGDSRREDPAYREAARLRTTEWRVKNPAKSRDGRRRRRARLRECGVFEFTERDWTRLVARYRGCCAYCGEKSDALQREHVIPIARGGRHSAGNILPACPRCNGSKKAKLLSEWRYQQRR